MIFLATLAFTARIQAQAPQSATNPAFDQLVAQASAARASGDLAQASSLYTQALHLNPAWPDGWWYLGQIHYAANEYPQAVDAFTHYLDLVPNAAPATALRGLCEFELGQFDPSLRDVQRALALGAADDTRNTQILRYHEALLLTRLGRFEEALTAYAYFGKQHLSSDDIYVAIGLAMLRLPILPADADPTQRESATQAGYAAFLLMSGDLDGAAQAFQQFFAKDPTTINVHYSYGYLLYPTDQDAAIAEFQREAAVDPGSALNHTMLAWSLLMENQPAEALPEAKKAAAEAPSLPLAQLSLGRALLETGDAKAATPILESALALQPANLEVHLALARAYSETGREADARRERLTCLQMTEHSTKPAPAMGQQEEPSAK
ncbi:MAG: tetratricopeptide repeat protein [Acidobacteriaceae bacterium]